MGLGICPSKLQHQETDTPHTTSTMADKKKGSGADSGSSPKHSKVSKIFEGLNKICCIAKELRDDTLGIDEFEKMLDNQKKLAEQLKAKDAQIANLTAEVESLKTAKLLLWEEFREQYQELNTELDDLRDVKLDLEETRTKLEEAEKAASAAKSDCKKFRLGVEKAAEIKKVAEEQLKSTQAALEDLQLRSTGVEVKYRELTEFVGEDQLHDRNVIELEEALEEFAAKCHDKIVIAFQALPMPPGPLPTRANPHTVAVLDSIPLPWSTSKESKLMRCALAEHVFAKALVDHIFVDISARHGPGLQQAVSTILGFLDGKDSRREAIVRSQLLAELADDDNGEHDITSALEYITDTLDQLVPPGTADESVYPMLEGLLREAAALWSPFRRSRYRISAELDVHWRHLVRTDDCYPIYGDPGPVGHPSEVVVPLFPQIVKRQDILVNPRVLWSDQRAVVEAREEIQKARDRSGPKDDGIAIQQPRRRNSIRASMVSPVRSSVSTLRSVVSPPKQQPASGSKARESNRGGDGGVRGTGTGGNVAGKGAACAVSVMVKLPEGGANGNKGPAAGS
ncbi:hypothetical protein QBC39DRAFT_150612 [Podospora conica]|nr:hypothetical protein QBC39DRAFT_150612 [Schizothecium conicum]